MRRISGFTTEAAETRRAEGMEDREPQIAPQSAFLDHRGEEPLSFAMVSLMFRVSVPTRASASPVERSGTGVALQADVRKSFHPPLFLDSCDHGLHGLHGGVALFRYPVRSTCFSPGPQSVYSV